MNENATAAQLGTDLSAETKSVLAGEVSQTKLIASLVLFVITLLCGYLPVRMILNQNYIQHAMFAGGGVLMATAFCHLIPEAHDSYKSLNLSSHTHQHHHQPVNEDIEPQFHLHQDESATSAFMARINGLNVPYLEMTLCFGFFFMYLCEQIMLKFINSHTHEHPCDTSTGQLIVGQPQQAQSQSQSQLQHQQQQQQQQAPFYIEGSTSVGNLSTSIAGSSLSRSSGATELYKFIRGLLIVSAFGMHSIFDGVAIGSQETVEKVWTIFAAISCHKLIIVAVVGLELFAATLESHLWTLVHLTIFSLMSPIGIILVVVAQNSLNIDSNHPSMILLQSFATGTLLYIIFVEILQPKEGHLHSKNRVWKSISLVVGFGLMLTVLTLIDH